MTGDTRRRVMGPMIAWDEVRACPVCGKDIEGMGEVSCGGHYCGYSFPNLRRIGPIGQFDWLTEAIYEPAPKSRRPYPHALLVLVMVSVAVGTLIIAALIYAEFHRAQI